MDKPRLGNGQNLNIKTVQNITLRLVMSTNHEWQDLEVYCST